MANASAGVVGAPVVEGVGWISGGYVNMYSFQEGEEVYLIDTGLSRKAKPIFRAFRDANVSIARVGKVLLTHHHTDHMGGAAYLREKTPAPLSCHTEDAPFVDGRVKAPMPLLLRLLLRTHPTPVTTLLRDGDRVGPLQVVHVPGHTPGEVAFYHPARKILFSGDSVVEQKGRLTIPGKRYAANLDQAVRSLTRLRALDVEVVLPGHGVPITKGFNTLLDDLIQRAPTEFLHQSAR
jgi:glyoxylase-like metal-dependent hydrolase (beta-lactamase superfamily II)